mmetsp:Transcript_24384/g.60087  ORF Transcript_24384/g.60087 Transcript_24384/m.60087 type:complete len:143 (-) Transcript_24384:179-607(-)
MNRAVAQMVAVGQIVGFGTAFFGDQIFAAISMPVPEWAKLLQDNRGMAIGAFFISNIFVNSLTQTGAFEIYLGGEIVHSKIKTGVVPDFPGLVTRLHAMNPALSEGKAKEPAQQQRHRIEHSPQGIQSARAQLPEDEEDDEF